MARCSGLGQDHQGAELQGAQCSGMPSECSGMPLLGWSPCQCKVNCRKIQLPPHRAQQSDSGNRIRSSSKTRQTDMAGLPFWFCRSCSKQWPRGLHSYWIILRLGFLENFPADGRAFSKRIYMTTFCSCLHKGLYLFGSPAFPSHSH